jgi:formylglycine-generating enzyme required for sulfatase activity
MKIMLLLLLSGMSAVLSSQNSVQTTSESDSTAKKAYTVQIVKVYIDSEPEGATVYIADEEIGKTPVSFEYPAGRHLINISFGDYPEIEEIIVIKAPETKNMFRFKDVRANLTVNTFKRARVYINDELFKNYEKIKLQAGEYKIKVEMDSVKTLEKIISLGEKEDKTIMLYPDFPRGAIQIDTSPDSVLIELWEEGFDKYTGKGSSVFNNLPAGKYNIKVSKRGHKSQTTEITLNEKKVEKFKYKLRKGSDIGGEYVLIEGGTFMMGGDGCSDEKPLHKVSLNSFYISRYETTQSEWNFIMGKNESEFTGDSLPVENVSWFDAVKFCNKLSESEGLQKCYSGSGNDIFCDFKANGYRLPTEAEWEYAAAGGKRDIKSIFSGSNNIKEVAVYEGNCKNSTKAVGSLKPNELGIYDMTGNVSEWCWDWYDVYPAEGKNRSNPSGPNKGFLRVIRGGSWFNYDKCSRVCCRNLYNPNDTYFYLGFRVARSK